MTEQIVIQSPGSCFPNSNQTLLLKAALLSGDEALFAWQEWSSLVDLNDLDWGEARLLPLLYHNLKQNKISETQIPGIFKGMYRRTWAENQILFHHATNLIRQFGAAGIPTMLLKGSALATQYYQDFGLRPMSNFDLLVPTHQAQESIEVAQKYDWISDYTYPKKISVEYTCCNHSWTAFDLGKRRLDLHWHVISSCLEPDADRDFWEAAIPIKILGVNTLMLNPADQLLDICKDGAVSNSFSPLRWIADAVMILNKYPDLDWQRLIEQTTKRRLMLPMQATLQFLQTHLAASIPHEVCAELGKIKATPEEEWFYYRWENAPLAARNLDQKIRWVFVQAANYYRRRRGLVSNTPVPWYLQLGELPSFLQQWWAVDSKWQIPGIAIAKILQHI